MYRRHSRNSKTTTKKEYEKEQEQVKETIEALNKQQNEAKNTISREINELSMKIDNIKEEVTHDMENLRKKNETEIQNKMEGHSSTLEQAEEIISEPEDEMVIKGKAEELLVRQLKTCERNMQEFTDPFKRKNVRIMGIEEGEEVQAKGFHNIFNKIITKNYQNLEKTKMPIQETSSTPNRLDQNRTTPMRIEKE
jgi:DNA repair exonuclease SbcCD ATPase subunit